MLCSTYSLPSSLELKTLAERLYQFKIDRHRDFIHLFDVLDNSICYIFSNGTIISWNFPIEKLNLVLSIVTEFLDIENKGLIKDDFFFEYGNQTNLYPDDEQENMDIILLENDDFDLKLSISYGLSQSIKLKYYENLIEERINSYMPFIRDLKMRGKIKLSRPRLMKIIGEILVLKGELNLVGNFLKQPKFFWQHPSYESYFLMVEKYMDITARAKNLNVQVNTLSEIFIMCNDSLEHRGSRFLEIAITVFVGMEVIFSLLNWHW